MFIILLLTICYVSFAHAGVEVFNVVTVPPNCPEGQEWINDQCRDVWIKNLVTVPPNCPSGQEYVNGQCRDVWSLIVNNEDSERYRLQGKSEVEVQNSVTVPPNCKDNQEWINGECRDIWKYNEQTHNLVTVPPNCSEGQEYINGACRDVWAFITKNLIKSLVKVTPENISEEVLNQAEQAMKNIVSVPEHCPNGYKPDSNGVCREIWSGIVAY